MLWGLPLLPIFIPQMLFLHMTNYYFLCFFILHLAKSYSRCLWPLEVTYQYYAPTSMLIHKHNIVRSRLPAHNYSFHVNLYPFVIAFVCD